MKAAQFFAELALLVLISPFLVILWTYVFIRAILRGLGIVICAFCESVTYLWRSRQ
jgi:hypothetical protein